MQYFFYPEIIIYYSIIVGYPVKVFDFPDIVVAYAWTFLYACATLSYRGNGNGLTTTTTTRVYGKILSCL